MATERLTEERLGIIERQGGVACQVSVLSMIEEIRACRAGTLAPPGCVVVREDDIRKWVEQTVADGDYGCEVCPLDLTKHCDIPQEMVEPDRCSRHLLAHFGLEVRDE